MASRSSADPRAAPRRARARPTITDVARAAGVSTGTVSHVLNGSREVSEARRARVAQAVAALGYVPNLLAQNLRRKRATLMGLCMPHASFGYFVALSEAFEALAAEQGYDILHVFSRQDAATELHRIETLLRYDIGGLLLLPSWEPQATLDRLAQAAVPTVIIDRPIDDRRFDQVMVDVRGALRRVVLDLAARGHRRVMFVSANPRLLISRHRIDGMRQAIAELGGSASLEILERAETEGALRQQLAAAMAGPERATALLVTNTQGVTQVARALRELGLRCPEHVSLVAVDEPPWAEMVTPTLAAIRPPALAVAQGAWDLLLARMEGGRRPPRRIALEPELRLNGTVGPPPAPRAGP
ncbi:MAG: LacI family DNA-binding transcriptional regulator [Alphaproteobacteria bacterium]|nr:LacI family DNA-binding transcriptional regulator [Alphaproteobacteria bacterium]